MTARRLTVEADGGSRGNPGTAGYGALVRDAHTGALLAERAEPLGRASNNVAEYRGLIAGLEAAQAIEPGAEIEARLDSKLVVEQMAGRWKIKHEDMRRLALRARDVVARISAAGGSVTFRWVPRAENTAADALSNLAMDGEHVDRTFGGEPEVEHIPRGEPTRVVLVRHGSTEFTVAGRLDGRGGANPPLSSLGRDQAGAAGELVAQLVAGHPARVVSSSLTRARQTAEAVAGAIGCVAQVDADWDEQHYGDWDGALIHDLLRDQLAEFARFRDDPGYARPGGETHTEVSRRVLAAFERVVDGGGTTVVVCHRTPIMVVLARLLCVPHDKAWRLAAAPASLHAVEVWPSTGDVSIAFTNRT